MIDSTTWEFKLCKGVRFHNNEPFNAESVPILNYFNDHITSGLGEGLNNKIKLIKRRGDGSQ